MATLHSFYLPPESWQPPFRLKDGEAHHLVKVLRLKAGANVRLFDGKGRHGLFTVESVSKSEVLFSRQSEAFSPAPRLSCTLAAGFSKALRRGWFFEKAVELEASGLWFWEGDYSQAALPEKEKDSWKASLVAGAKQCEAAWLPELRMVQNGLAGVVSRLGDFDKSFMLYEGDTEGRLLEREDLTGEGRLLMLVGPEGGFSPREADLARQAGVTPVSLGNRVLRWETAAVLTLGLAWWARQGNDG